VLLLRNPATATAQPITAHGSAERDSTWRELLRSGRFYAVWAMFFSGAMAGLRVIGILKPFAESQLLRTVEQVQGILAEPLRNELLLKGATAVGVLSLFNAAGRVIWGWLSDRMGRSVTMTAMFVLQGFTLLSLTTLDTEVELAVGAACVRFNFGGNFVLFPSLTADLFGSKNFGSNYVWVFTSYGIAGVLGVWGGTRRSRSAEATSAPSPSRPASALAPRWCRCGSHALGPLSRMRVDRAFAGPRVGRLERGDSKDGYAYANQLVRKYVPTIPNRPGELLGGSRRRHRVGQTLATGPGRYSKALLSMVHRRRSQHLPQLS